ncbi:poly(3-hydroxybutyrate) depolymerase [Pseudoroseomonas rhizosphaerae]|uniref:Poly(3-hydroxybutyrate) depolymerase n=1 Tax=Teichococcus rhizosphaerae TaxID=1335062 RepID=A0A2C7AF83_9PROT|nr:polyhydroxyalkanoate depolymerase [Pseudoroseomonas rhizosphaerae]PHK96105.1 poly(3-hydroxybutyrate) depolymerase [Pseudoroseomonas rhizosphaerae]
MMYQIYQAQQDLMTPIRLFARGTGAVLRQFDTGRPETFALRQLTAALELLGSTGITHTRPPFGFTSVEIGNRDVAVEEVPLHSTPFGTLLHFRKDIDLPQPKVLVVAPMSGHFATLLRGTVQVLLPENDVYITDWTNARDVPLSAGRFGMDEFIDHVIRFQEEIGQGGHVLAVCQPAVPVLAAVAAMSESRNPATPRSMTLMAGPIDTRISPTKVNELAQGNTIEWFEKNLVDTVPWRFQGGGRKVYPGALQLTAFMSMNMNRHVRAHLEQYRNLVGGDSELADAHRRFYDEYLAVMDLPAEFYLETVRTVFQEHHMPLGKFHYRGRLVRPELIRHTRLLTVEGERDDICAIGQTAAALDLCSGLPAGMKRNHLQTGAGHYGVFSGRRWANEVYPLVRDTIEAAS